jgi:protein-S-isoprenylcysteine O-methyltransferase Ste14
MLFSGQKNIMKKLSMGLAALMTIAPAPFAIGAISPDPIIKILIIVILSWACVEFYIGLSRPCKGKAPSLSLVKIGRMVWPLFIVYSWLDFRHNWTRLYFPSWFYALLILSCILALVVRIWAVIHLGKSFSYDVNRPEGGILITTGPYRVVRHPAYLAVCILGSFPGLILGSILGFIGMLTTTVFTVVYRTNAEEQMLEKEFGDLFTKYKRNTYRLFPFIY